MSLCYKLDSRRLESRKGYWIFFQFTLSFQTYYSTGVDWASNKNEYQEMFIGNRERPARKADNLNAISEPIMQKMWELRRLITL
jgi:hypothetical protein